MEESFALAIHKALHNWRDVEGEVDLLGDGEILLHRLEWVPSRRMERAPPHGTEQIEIIELGRKGEEAIKGSKPSTEADLSDNDDEDKSDPKTNESEDEEEEEEEEDEEDEEEFDMSNKITELRAFTKKHGIKVVGRKKEDVLNAITKWKKQRKLEREARKAKKAAKKDEEASENEDAEQGEGEQEERVKTPAKPPAQPVKRRSKAEPTERKTEEIEQAAPEKEEEATANKPVEVEEEAPVAEEQAARTEKISEESEQDEGDIEIDIDLDELDSYNLKTLKAYCEEEGLRLPAGARKQDYIAAILNYNADILNEDDGHDGAVIEAHLPKPKCPEPNEVVGATSPVQAESKQDEGEEEDEDLDLDDLESYSLATLKRYCADEGIAVAGTKKEVYVKAILDYNDSGERSWLEVSRADDDGESPREEAKTSDREEAKRDGEKKASVECDVEEIEETEVEMWKRKAAKWKQRARELQRLNELQGKAPQHQRRMSGNVNNKENAPPAQVAKTGVRA